MHTGIPSVVLDEKGECNYCKIHDAWDKEYGLKTGRFKLFSIFDEIEDVGKNELYDCVIGISGGCDSSWLLDFAVNSGLRPLAVHFDNNWNTKIADNNMRKMCQQLGVTSYRIGVKPNEYNDLCRAFLFASTPDADIPNDIALTTALYQAADKFNIKYILNAHSFRTEGTTPLGLTYMDGGYIKDVHLKFGREKIESYPNLDYVKFKHYINKGIKRIRPIWYLDYNKKEAIEHLEKTFGWEWYKAHHHENIYTKFVGGYLWVRKFGIDLRYVEYSALIRSGFMNRDEALSKVKLPALTDALLPYNVRRKLGINKDEWWTIFNTPVKSYRDYNTYEELFRQDKAFFKKALKAGKIPETFYKKYVEGVKSE
jgi:hypothetical protein